MSRGEGGEGGEQGEAHTCFVSALDNYVSMKRASLNRSSVIWYFKQSDAFQTQDEITFHFNTGLSQIFLFCSISASIHQNNLHLGSRATLEMNKLVGRK